MSLCNVSLATFGFCVVLRTFVVLSSLDSICFLGVISSCRSKSNLCYLWSSVTLLNKYHYFFLQLVLKIYTVLMKSIYFRFNSVRDYLFSNLSSSESVRDVLYDFPKKVRFCLQYDLSLGFSILFYFFISWGHFHWYIYIFRYNKIKTKYWRKIKRNIKFSVHVLVSNIKTQLPMCY